MAVQYTSTENNAKAKANTKTSDNKSTEKQKM